MSNEFSPLVLAAHATAALPGLEIVGLTEPYDNDGSMARQGIVDAQGKHWVVCTPLTDQAGADMQAQVTLLRILHRSFEKGFLPFDAPVPVANKRGGGDIRVLVHPEMRGTPGSWEQMDASSMLTGSMAKAIAALHDLPAEAIEFTGLPVYTAEEVRERLLFLLDEAVNVALIPPNLYDRWDDALRDESLFRFEPTPVHGDLGPDSFLCSADTVSSVSAFASAHLGDPAEDLGWILSGSKETRDHFLRVYQDSRKDPDLHLAIRAQLWAELALLRWLLHGKRIEDNEVIEDAKAMLADLASEVGDDPLIPGHTSSNEVFEEADLDEVNRVLPVELDVDPNAPTVNLGQVLNLDFRRNSE
ncbi:MAG: phosphotransferase [Actinomycetaceae bacterium]|nr:phosphotransferase [Actinomycetaceae bacterium]